MRIRKTKNSRYDVYISAEPEWVSTKGDAYKAIHKTKGTNAEGSVVSLIGDASSGHAEHAAQASASLQLELADMTDVFYELVLPVLIEEATRLVVQ